MVTSQMIPMWNAAFGCLRQFINSFTKALQNICSKKISLALRMSFGTANSDLSGVESFYYDSGY